jgi:hypothetical protein
MTSETSDAWKALAMRNWLDAAVVHNDDELRESGAMRYASLLEVERMKSTLSWRVTAPLRMVRGQLR